MSVRVFIDGAITGPEGAMVPVFDRGFLYGDSVYEVMRTAGGVPVDLAPHLDRLENSAAGIALQLPPRAALIEAVQCTLDAAGNPESYVRVVVTRGSAEIGLDTALASEPRTIVMVRPLVLPDPEVYRDGVDLIIVARTRTSPTAMDPALKSGNYLNNILALHEAKQAGAHDALMCNAAGQVAEGSTSNFFAVVGGKMITPPLTTGLLAGITRGRVIELARNAGIAVREALLWPEQVRGADEAFITSSIRGVVPVRVIDGRTLGSAVPGPQTVRVMELYAGYLAQAAA